MTVIPTRILLYGNSYLRGRSQEKSEVDAGN